jgi:arsenate reductase
MLTLSINEPVDLVITVCDQAAGECPMFPGTTEVLHMGFPDPAPASGTEEEIMAVFRQVRDALKAKLIPFIQEKAAAAKLVKFLQGR